MSKSKPTPAEVVALYREAVKAHNNLGPNICKACAKYNSLKINDACFGCAIGYNVNYEEKKESKTCES